MSHNGFRWSSPTTVVALVLGVALVVGYGAWREGWRPTFHNPLANSADSDTRIYNGFEGTNAASYAEGAAGIVPPPAAKAGDWSAADVARDLSAVKAALVSSHLDHRLLVTGDPAGYLAQVAPGYRSLAKLSLAKDSFSEMIRTAPGTTLADLSPRVKGKMTFGVGKDEDGHSYLQITTNYVWAYAFAGVGTNHPGEHVVVVHDETKWGSYSDSHVGPESRGLWVEGTQAYVYNMDCQQIAHGLIAPASWKDQGTGVAGGGEDYSPDQPVDGPDTCPNHK
ncbi:hypothetical protein [Fodinicola feengrottensis]